MIVTCQKCNSNFKLDDNLVKPTGSTVRCSTCRNVFVIYKENNQIIDEEEDFTLPQSPGLKIDDDDLDKDLSDSDLDLSDIQVDFDDDIEIKNDLDLDDDQEEDIDLEGLELDLPDLDEDDDIGGVDDLDLSEIQIDFDDEPASKKDDDDFDLPDLDDLDLPDLDDLEDGKEVDDLSMDDDLTDFDLEEIAGDMDDSKLEDDLDFDLSLDDDLLATDLDDDKDDKNGFLEATDYGSSDSSDEWNVDNIENEEKPKKRGCLFILFSMIIVAALAAGGIYYAVTQKYLNIDKIVLPDFVNKVFSLDEKGKAKLMVAPYNSSNLRLIRNKNAGVISVIEGSLKNGYKEIRKQIRVSAKFHVKDKAPISKTVYCGNIIADIDLANMTKDEIEKRLHMKDGDEDKYKEGVKPGDSIPFMIVFFDLPEDVKGFSVEPVSSNL